MILPVLSALRGPGIATLRHLGLQAIGHALQHRRAEVIGVALARLTKDGDLELLQTDRPLFVRKAVFALLRAVFDFDGGGRLADLGRDEFCRQHGESTAEALAGITDGREAVERVLALLAGEMR